MNTRINTFYARTTHSSDVTIIEDINIKDPISQIVIQLEATNSSATQTAHPCACITKIELVDGSDVLVNLDGYEADALDWYHNGGKFRSNYNTALNGGGHTRVIGLNFGRYLYDPEFALDPMKFDNLQLKITLDIDAGANAASANYITCWAAVFDEKTISPRGFLTAKEIKEYTMASATHNYTDLPTDYPYTGIYFRPFLAGTEPNQCVTNIKISEDQDKRVPFDHGAQDINRILCQMYGDVEEHYYFADDTSAKYLYIAPSTRVAGLIQAWKATAPAGSHSFYDGDGGRAAIIAGTAGENINVYVRGAIPHCVYELPVCDKMNPEDWYQVQNVGSLRADITGAASATGFLFIQQFRPY